MNDLAHPGPAGSARTADAALATAPAVFLRPSGPAGRSGLQRTGGRSRGGTPPRARLLAVVGAPARPESVSMLRRLARTAVRDEGLSEQVDEALAVIVTELATNVVLHSGSPDLELLIQADDTGVTVRVRDRGHWKQRLTPRCEAADVHAAFGRGLALVSAYAADTTVERGPTGTVVQATVNL